MRILRLKVFVIIISFVSFSVFAQTEKSESTNVCSQNNAEKLEFIKKAEENQYNVRHIYIVGNTYTRYRTFRERWDKNFEEGAIFTRDSLMKSIEGMNKLKTIKKISLDNIEVRIEEKDTRGWNAIDFDICVEQKRK